MADDADLASQEEQFRLQCLLQNRINTPLPFTGHCHYCFGTVLKGLFCDADCRADYEKRLYFRR